MIDVRNDGDIPDVFSCNLVVHLHVSSQPLNPKTPEALRKLPASLADALNLWTHLRLTTLTKKSASFRPRLTIQ
jgi:hypothetical protein